MIPIRTGIPLLLWALLAAGATLASAADAPEGGALCVSCHEKVTPGIVSDWKLSRHRVNDVDCSVCHGSEHTTADDAREAKIPTPDTCGGCHQSQHEQFARGKHAKGWAAMKAMPTIHWQPMALIEGMKGCGGCHKIGLKSDEEIRSLGGAGGGAFGVASCDSCHTRHLFSADEARQPQACQTCHMGFDHPQWEMYSSSKHGVRHALKATGALPASAAAPTCQTCHMERGDHEVRTAWGFLAVRLPMPADATWAADRTTILQALGVLDPAGKPTARLEAVKSADLARLDEDSFQRERGRMLAVCGQCHAPRFAAEQMRAGDEMIRQADHLMAEAIRTVAGLYADGTLRKPESYAAAFPDLLTFHDAPTPVEQRLFVMYLEHRMRTFQGTFHANPDYALWYGWSEMQRDLTEIRSLADEMRRRGGKEAPEAAADEAAAQKKKKKKAVSIGGVAPGIPGGPDPTPN